MLALNPSRLLNDSIRTSPSPYEYIKTDSSDYTSPYNNPSPFALGTSFHSPQKLKDLPPRFEIPLLQYVPLQDVISNPPHTCTAQKFTNITSSALLSPLKPSKNVPHGHYLLGVRPCSFHKKIGL